MEEEFLVFQPPELDVEFMHSLKPLWLTFLLLKLINNNYKTYLENIWKMDFICNLLFESNDFNL